MIKMLQNLTFFCFLITFFSCTSSNEITINKVEGSPSYENAKLSMADVVKGDNEYSFSFALSNYELGIQTKMILTIVLQIQIKVNTFTLLLITIHILLIILQSLVKKFKREMFC